MRRGNIHGSHEPVNKVNSSGGSFSSPESEGGVKEVPLRQEKKENVKHTLDRERPGGIRGMSTYVRVPHANVWVREFAARSPRESSEARLALHAVTCSSISGPPSWPGYRMRRCFSSNAVSDRAENEKEKREKKGKRKREGDSRCQSLGRIV